MGAVRAQRHRQIQSGADDEHARIPVLGHRGHPGQPAGQGGCVLLPQPHRIELGRTGPGVPAERGPAGRGGDRADRHHGALARRVHGGGFRQGARTDGGVRHRLSRRQADVQALGGGAHARADLPGADGRSGPADPRRADHGSGSGRTRAGVAGVGPHRRRGHRPHRAAGHAPPGGDSDRVRPCGRHGPHERRRGRRLQGERGGQQSLARHHRVHR